MRELLESWLADPAHAAWLRTFLLVAARVAPMSIVAPWFALRNAPAMVRAGVVFALSAALVATAAPASVSAEADARTGGGLAWPLLLGSEALLGTVFALIASMPFFALDWAGRLTDLWRGASAEDITAPAPGDRTSPLGAALLLFAVAVFCALGGHVRAFEAFAETLRAVPVGSIAWTRAASDVGLLLARAVGGGLLLAWVVATPAAALLVLSEITFGLVGRAAPQIPLFFASMPLRAALGLGAVLVAVPALGGVLPRWFAGAIAEAQQLLLIFHAR